MMAAKNDTLKFRRRTAALLMMIAALATVVVIYAAVVAAAGSGADDGPRFGSRQADLADARLSATDHIARGPAGLRMTNLPEGIVAVFDPGRTRIEYGGRGVSLTLVALGRGARMTSVDRVAPEEDADRVNYRRGVVNEWFLDGPSGIEQGLTMVRPPAQGRGPLTLSYSVQGARPQVMAGGRGVSLGASRDLTFSYLRLRARDSIGRRVRVWFTADDEQLQLHIEDHSHSYPLEVDPTVEIEVSDGVPATDQEIDHGHSEPTVYR